MEIDSKDAKFLINLGKKLREIRKSKGWTLEETEEHGWLNWRHLQKIENGKNVTLVTVRKLAVLYKIKISQIFEDL